MHLVSVPSDDSTVSVLDDQNVPDSWSFEDGSADASRLKTEGNSSFRRRLHHSCSSHGGHSSDA